MTASRTVLHHPVKPPVSAARSRGSKRALLLACAIAGAVSGKVAFADPTPADRETARALMQEGRDLRDAGDNVKAMARFRAADDVMHVPTTGLELARTQAALGLLVEARDTVASIRRTPSKPGDPEPFNEARRRADELDWALEGRVPTLTVVVLGATPIPPVLSMDGVVVPAATVGLPRSVDPGHHVILVRAGPAQAQLEIDLAEGERRQLSLAPVAPGPGADESPGSLAPAQPSSGRAGERSHAPGAVTYAGLGVGVVGLAVGIVGGAISWSDKSSLRAECPGLVCPPGQPSRDLDSANTMAVISNVSFILAGIGAGIGIASIVVGTPGPASPAASGSTRVQVTPVVGARFVGMRGSF
jgi:hypothetical protein